MAILFHDNDFSTCAQKVRILLNELGETWETHWLDLRAGDQHKADYLALNPAGVVPTLVVDGAVLVESNPILEFLTDRDGEQRFRPADPVGRHAMRLWFLRLDTGLHAAIGGLSIGISFRYDYLERGADALAAHLAGIPDPARRARWQQAVVEGMESPGFAQSLAAWVAALATLERQLAQNAHAAGDDYSLADIALAPYLTRLDHLGVLSPLADRFPRALDLYQRVRARPAYVRAITETISPAKLARISGHAEVAREAVSRHLAALR